MFEEKNLVCHNVFWQLTVGNQLHNLLLREPITQHDCDQFEQRPWLTSELGNPGLEQIHICLNAHSVVWLVEV